MIDFIGLPEPGSGRPFSRATKAAGFIFVSGSSAPHDPASGIYRGDTAGEQVRNSLRAIAEILSTAGSGLDRVVQVTMLIRDHRPATRVLITSGYASGAQQVVEVSNGPLILKPYQPEDVAQRVRALTCEAETH